VLEPTRRVRHRPRPRLLPRAGPRRYRLPRHQGPADALLLDAFADKTSDRVWTLGTVSLLSALDTKRTLKELRRYPARRPCSRCREPSPPCWPTPNAPRQGPRRRPGPEEHGVIDGTALTRKYLMALPPAVDLQTANKVLSIGRTTGYGLATRAFQRLPVRVFRECGRRSVKGRWPPRPTR
jgi:hypothetical protein